MTCVTACLCLLPPLDQDSWQDQHHTGVSWVPAQLMSDRCRPGYLAGSVGERKGTLPTHGGATCGCAARGDGQ